MVLVKIELFNDIDEGLSILADGNKILFEDDSVHGSRIFGVVHSEHFLEFLKIVERMVFLSVQADQFIIILEVMEIYVSVKADQPHENVIGKVFYCLFQGFLQSL